MSKVKYYIDCPKCLGKRVPEAHQCNPAVLRSNITQGERWLAEIDAHMANTDVVEKPVNKYEREILPNVWVDVYDVIAAFEVTDGGMAHALKKILATGKRGHKDEAEDRKDILASVKRSNEIFNRK